MRATRLLSAILVASLCPLAVAAMCVGCKRLPWSHHDEPEEAQKPQALGCSLHPDYCRNRCKNLQARMRSRHAERIDPPSTARFGTCGDLVVFEETGPGDAGIAEYFDDAGDIVGAVDNRGTGDCKTFGTVPTCTPAWRSFPEPKATAQKTAATGSIDTSALGSGLTYVTWRLEDCHRLALWDDPTVHGTIEVIAEGSPDGGALHWTAGETKLEGTSAALATCTLEAFRAASGASTEAKGVHVIVEFTPKPTGAK